MARDRPLQRVSFCSSLIRPSSDMLGSVSAWRPWHKRSRDSRARVCQGRGAWLIGLGQYGRGLRSRRRSRPLPRLETNSNRSSGRRCTMKALRHVYVQVLIGIAAGLILGLISPKLAVDMKPLADGFVKLIKMCVGPIVFLAIVHGINSAGNLKTAGRVG